MTTLYTGEQFWTDRNWVVTAQSPKGNYKSRSEFCNDVNRWMDEHGIQYAWSGESTHEHDFKIVYYYHVKIADSKHRTFFSLRWS